MFQLGEAFSPEGESQNADIWHGMQKKGFNSFTHHIVQ